MSAQPPALGRPIETLSDAALELLAKGLIVRQRMRLLGVFTPSTAAAASPPPTVGDAWIEYTPAGSYLYVQLAERPRLRARLSVTLEDA